MRDTDRDPAHSHGGYTALVLRVPASRIGRRCERVVPMPGYQPDDDAFVTAVRACGGVLWRTLGGVIVCEACDTVRPDWAD